MAILIICAAILIWLLMGFMSVVFMNVVGRLTDGHYETDQGRLMFGLTFLGPISLITFLVFLFVINTTPIFNQYNIFVNWVSRIFVK